MALISPASATSLVVGNSKKPCGISDTDEGDFCLNPAAAAQPLERLEKTLLC